MQTPAAIGILFLLTTVLTNKVNNSDEEAIEDEISLNNENNASENNLSSDDKEITNKTVKGFITINNNKQEVTMLELLDLIESTKKNFTGRFNEAKFKDAFRKLVNGVFQAEGHIGGYFSNTSTVTFRPIVYLSQNASDSSIEFLVLLWLILDKNFKFAIYRNESSNNFHIRLFTRDWKFIIEKLIPYFSLVYGDKFKGFLKLKDIHDLLQTLNLSNDDKVKIISLAYSLVDNSRRKTSISDKISSVLGETKYTKQINIYSHSYPENNKPLSVLFILGFLLGDGNFAIRIRRSQKGVWFIPIIRLEQKYTLDNRNLLNNILQYLTTQSVNGRIFEYVKTLNSNHIVLIIENKSVHNFVKIIKEYRELFFWKKEQIEIIIDSLVIISVAARHWKESQIALLRILYKNQMYNPRLKFSFDYWVKTFYELYDEKKKSSALNEFYITMSKNVSWAVNLPVALNIKPKTKYFFFKTFNNSKEEALRAAIDYRNAQLNKWLSDKGFK